MEKHAARVPDIETATPPASPTEAPETALSFSAAASVVTAHDAAGLPVGEAFQPPRSLPAST